MSTNAAVTETTAEWTTENDRAPADEVEGGNAPADEVEGGNAPADEVEGGNAPADEVEGGNAPADEVEGGSAPADEVAALRAEAAKYRRQRSELRDKVDTLQQRLFTELVRATGLMIDPEDMPVSVELLDDPEELHQRVQQYVEKKPHLRRRAFPQVGLHDRGQPTGPTLADILRTHA